MMNKQRKTTTTTNNKKKKEIKKEVKEVIRGLPQMKKNPMGSLPSTSPTVSKYLIALNDAFDPRAEGVQVPDRYPFPTEAFHTKNYYIPDNSNNGAFQVNLLPSIALSIIDVLNTTATGTDLLSSGTSSGGNVYYPCKDSQASAIFDSVRTVACTWEITCDTNLSNTQGYIICTPFICANQIVPQGTLGDYTTAQLAMLVCNGAVPTESAPGSIMISVNELIGNRLLLNSRPVAPSGYSFRSCDGSTPVASGGDAFIGGEIFSNTTGLVTSPGNRYDHSNCDNMIGWIIAGVGLADSSNSINIRMAMHVEGVHTRNLNSNDTLQPSNCRLQPARENIETVLSKVTSALVRVAPSLLSAFNSGGVSGVARSIAKMGMAF
jgi:hypothetical protein